jgi:acyl carrier protein
MKNVEEITNKIKILAKEKNFPLDLEKIDLNGNLREYGIDSLDLATFIFDLEPEFDIRFDEKELGLINSINDIIRIIASK